MFNLTVTETNHWKLVPLRLILWPNFLGLNETATSYDYNVTTYTQIRVSRMLASLLFSISCITSVLVFLFFCQFYQPPSLSATMLLFLKPLLYSGVRSNKKSVFIICQFIMSISLSNLQNHEGIRQESQITQLGSTCSFWMNRKKKKQTKQKLVLLSGYLK